MSIGPEEATEVAHAAAEEDSAAGDPTGVDTGQPPTRVLLRDAPTHRLTRGQLRGPHWDHLSQGLYGSHRPERSCTDLAADLRLVLPRDSGFGHLTNAALRGWWMPNQLGPHVSMATTTSRVHVQRRGLYVRRSDHAVFDEIAGIPSLRAEPTLVELARDLCLVDLVPMVDRALADGAEPEEILAAAQVRAPGTRTLRAAVGVADERSESWWESVLRLLHVLTGLGPVESQVDLFNDGIFVARADLHLIGTSRYPECDGGGHRGADRHDHDLGRDKWMHRSALERYGYTTGEITRHPEMIIRDAEDARGLPHDPRRIRTWWRWAKPSTLTGYGRARLARRLDRYQRAANR